MDGTYIISYLHLQELKWFCSPNQNKSKARNFNCSHQVVNLILPRVSVLTALSELLASPGWRIMGLWEEGQRENSADCNGSSLMEGNSQPGPVKHKGQRNIACVRVAPSWTVSPGDSWGLLTQALPTQVWGGCYASIIFLRSVSLEEWTELELGPHRDQDLQLPTLRIIEACQLVNIYLVPITRQMSSW